MYKEIIIPHSRCIIPGKEEIVIEGVCVNSQSSFIE